jgi:soluble lytic murein transglycosylase-like protein
MTYLQIISTIAKAAKVPAVLLYAMCNHESNGFKYDYTLYDHGTPSFSVCQIKSGTARMMGWKGKNEMELRNPSIGIKYAALYLAHQQAQYGNDWVKVVASYNSGTYTEGKKKGCPRNLKYVRLVQQKLPENLKYKLECGKD